MKNLSKLVSALVGASLIAMPMSAYAADKPGTTSTTASVVVAGGGSSNWTVRDDSGTTNGLPSGGTCNTGTQAAMSDANIPSHGDAFDEGMMYWVNNTPVGGALTQAGNTVTFAGQTISGLSVALRYDILTTEATARSYLALTNSTGAAITVPVNYATNLGSDSGTIFLNTSSGDAVVTVADKWIVSADNATTPSDAVNTTVLFSGSPAIVPSSVSTTVFDCASTPGVLATYSVTVPAGSTVAIANFQRLDATIAAANAAAPAFNNIASTSPLLAGLSAAQLGAIRNLGIAAPAITEIPTGSTTTWVLLSALLAALVGFSRRRWMR